MDTTGNRSVNSAHCRRPAIHELKLQHYVGKIVRLNQQAFQQIRDRARRQGVSLENSFLVTEVRLGMKKLICYGASFRIEVDVADVVLV